MLSIRSGPILGPRAPATGRAQGEGNAMPVPRIRANDAVLAGGCHRLRAQRGRGGAAWAATEPGAQARDAAAQLHRRRPCQSPSRSSPPGSPDKAQSKTRRAHGESVVKKGDGSFETRLTQMGTVEAVSDRAITVKSEDGFSQDYAISADTRIRK